MIRSLETGFEHRLDMALAILTLSALGVKGSSKDGLAAFSLSRMFTSRGFRKPARLATRGVELSTADMRAAFALRLTADGLMLRRSAEMAAFLADLGMAPVLLALGPAQVPKLIELAQLTLYIAAGLVARACMELD